MTAASRSRHHIHAPRSLGEQLADSVVNGMGSWRFIIIQSIVVGAWIVANVIGWSLRWDVYPFILLNLLFSTQAAYASPLIMMAQNRQAAIDRKRDDHEAAEVDQLFAINQQQLAILNQQTEILTLLHQLIEKPKAARAAAATKPSPAPPQSEPTPISARSHRRKPTP